MLLLTLLPQSPVLVGSHLHVLVHTFSIQPAHKQPHTPTHTRLPFPAPAAVPPAAPPCPPTASAGVLLPAPCPVPASLLLLRQGLAGFAHPLLNPRRLLGLYRAAAPAQPDHLLVFLLGIKGSKKRLRGGGRHERISMAGKHLAGCTCSCDGHVRSSGCLSQLPYYLDTPRSYTSAHTSTHTRLHHFTHTHYQHCIMSRTCCVRFPQRLSQQAPVVLCRVAEGLLDALNYLLCYMTTK